MQREQIAAPSSPKVDSRIAALRRLAVIPALNEEDSIAGVIAEIHAADPGFEAVVVDDGSKDRTAQVAEAAGAHVVRHPYNLGIGGAVQTGLQYARDHAFEVAVHMRLRGAGASSITFWRSAYYMLKVLLALFVGLFRRYPTPQEDQ